MALGCLCKNCGYFATIVDLIVSSHSFSQPSMALIIQIYLHKDVIRLLVQPKMVENEQHPLFSQSKINEQMMQIYLIAMQCEPFIVISISSLNHSKCYNLSWCLTFSLLSLLWVIYKFACENVIAYQITEYD